MCDFWEKSLGLVVSAQRSFVPASRKAGVLWPQVTAASEAWGFSTGVGVKSFGARFGEF